MSRAKDLFLRLQSLGLDELDLLIDELEPESLFLDFKRAHNDGVGRLLSDSDNKNLSKAISGFSNAEGGIVIWGVDCRVDATTGNEVARKQPIADAAGFRTKLESAVSRCSVPPASNIEMLHINEADSDARGFVVTHIPKSLVGPVRSTQSNHYHVRTGSGFSIISHDVLAGMFGKSPSPVLWPQYLSHNCKLSERQDFVSIRFGFAIHNAGAVLAHKPYVSLRHGPLPPEFIYVNVPHEDIYALKRGIMPMLSVIAISNNELAPGSADHLCDINLNLPVRWNQNIRIEGTVGSMQSTPMHFSASLSSETFERLLRDLQTRDQVSARDYVTFDPSSD